jgi:HAD superfamily phosphoserine phosphatase-like hydrolase
MKARYVVASDFDTTFTEKAARSLFSFLEDNGGLGAWAKQKILDLRNSYLTRFFAGQLTSADEKKWFNETIAIYIGDGLKMDKVRQILKAVELRKGVDELLKLAKARNVPLAIVSAGIKDFIEIVLEARGVRHLVSEIYATKLLINQQNGDILGYYPDTVVVTADKGTYSRLFAEKYGVPPERILAIGDSAGDRNLGHLKENRVAIVEEDEEAVQVAPYAGHVVVSQDFYPVIEWFSKKIDGKS